MNLNFLQQYKVGLGLVLLTWLVFFSPIISGQYTYFLDDLKIIYYPIEALYAQAQHAWELPVWANEFGFGQPLIAWGQLGFFTPLHLIMRALYIPPLPLLQISVVSYFLLGSIGMFVFLIKRKFHEAAAALGAVLFAYCGFNIGHLNHVNFYTSTMVLPWLLLAIHACIEKTTPQRATTLALVATAIIVSGQPQVVLYVFIVAAIIALAMFIQRPGVRTVSWTIYAGILAFLLSSFALLPLQEFLPDTERSAGLPKTELFEFSYPPYETITLVLPYFFGDHANYFGPKGFQELAAYLGIIPLMLAGVALSCWRSHTWERIAGIVLALVGGILVLGKYSFLYTYLVENNYITSIGVVGRFVFFFDIGILILAVLGLHDLLTIKKVKIGQRMFHALFALLFPILLIAIPFGIYMSGEEKIQERFYLLFTFQSIFWWAIGLGIAATLFVIVARFSSLLFVRIRTWTLPLLSAMTLVVYGWGYNPVVPASSAYTPSPFIQDLQQYRDETGLPARLYAAEHLPVEGNPHVKVTLSDYISPHFTVIQPLIVHNEGLRCLVVPIQADSQEESKLTITIREGIDGAIHHTQEISSKEAYENTDQEICFEPLSKEKQNTLTMTLSSEEETNMKVFVTESENDASNVYFLRVKNPTPLQLTHSLKPLSIQYIPQFPSATDTESALLMRHIQALGGASSARWIGALSIRPYREFVDTFFANDSDAFDGDGVHALTRNKNLVDMTGITHFTQLLEYGQTNDPMLAKGYELVREADTGTSLIRLYKNPNAYPKAFVVPEAEFVAANDEIRFRLRDQSYDPKAIVYVSGPMPPKLLPTDPATPLISSTKILSYTNTRVDIEVTSSKDAFLVLTDSTTPQWHTFIDDVPALQLSANSIFKAAQIPSGKHVVSFRYESKAIRTAQYLTLLGVILTIIGYAYHPLRNLAKK